MRYCFRIILFLLLVCICVSQTIDTAVQRVKSHDTHTADADDDDGELTFLDPGQFQHEQIPTLPPIIIPTIKNGEDVEGASSGAPTSMPTVDADADSNESGGDVEDVEGASSGAPTSMPTVDADADSNESGGDVEDVEGASSGAPTTTPLPDYLFPSSIPTPASITEQPTSNPSAAPSIEDVQFLPIATIPPVGNQIPTRLPVYDPTFKPSLSPSTERPTLSPTLFHWNPSMKPTMSSIIPIFSPTPASSSQENPTPEQSGDTSVDNAPTLLPTYWSGYDGGYYDDYAVEQSGDVFDAGDSSTAGAYRIYIMIAYSAALLMIIWCFGGYIYRRISVSFGYTPLSTFEEENSSHSRRRDVEMGRMSNRPMNPYR